VFNMDEFMFHEEVTKSKINLHDCGHQCY